MMQMRRNRAKQEVILRSEGLFEQRDERLEESGRTGEIDGARRGGVDVSAEARRS